MTRQPKTAKPQTLASAAMGLLNDHHISALIVVEGDVPVGVVHFHDLLRIGAVPEPAVGSCAGSTTSSRSVVDGRLDAHLRARRQVRDR